MIFKAEDSTGSSHQMTHPHPPEPRQILRFRAKTVRGAGRGRGLGVPTINMDIADVPAGLTHGIYACWIVLDGKRLPGAMHYGPRPAFNDSESLEVHIIGERVTDVPEEAEVEVIRYLREVRNFADAEALKRAMEQDIRRARGILGV